MLLIIKTSLALLYDCVIVIALLLFGTLLAVLMHHGRAFTPGQWLFQTYLLMIILSYFFGCLYLRGQTVGMRAWRLRFSLVN